MTETIKSQEEIKPALGLTREDSEETIRRKAFEAIRKTGYMTFCTVGTDGKTPTNRGLEVHSLDDTDALYIGLCPGKPVYAELKKNPRISGGIIINTKGRLTYSIRINAIAEEIRDEKLMAEYWRLNPGTEKLYKRNMENFTLFRLEKGEGEVFDVYEDDKLLRFRFGFGGMQARPWYYEVNDKCTGCGSCEERCMTQVIEIKSGKAVIDHAACLECGDCYNNCPCGAIDRNEWEG